MILLDTATAAQEVATLSTESLIGDLALILILGSFATLLFKWLRQPVVLGYIVAGFLASPHFTYLPSISTEANIEFWAQIGIIVLLFSLGLEFSFKKLVNAGGSAVVTALFIVSGMMCAGYLVGHALGFSNMNSLFLGGMLSMSSTTIIIKAFTDLGLRQRKFASLVFAVLIVEDLFAVVMMVLLSSIAVNNSVEGGEMLYSISKLLFFLIIWFAVGVFILPTLLNSQREYLNSETLLVVSMGLCLGMAVFSVACGFSLALGAFVMGSILAGTSFAERIEHLTQPVKDLFGSVFFISVGMMVDPAIIAQYWVPILVLSAVVIVGMIFFGTFGMLLTGQTLKTAMESGFSLTQIGEFAFIIASLGMSLGVLDPQIYPIVVAVSVLTTFTTPYFIRMADPAYNWTEAHLPKKLHFLIDRYSEHATAEQNAAKALWSSLIKRYLWRVILYSIVLIALTIISLHYVLPFMVSVFPVWGRLFTALGALAAMSPFLLALTYPASQHTERQRLRECNAHFDIPLIAMTVVRLMIAMTLIVYLLSSIFSLAVGWTFGVALFIIMLLTYSKRVKARLEKIETRFIDNLNERDLRRTGAKNSLLPNFHLAYIKVGYDCPFVGDKLMTSGLRAKYGVSVSSIRRGQHLIMVPGADARIFPGDILGIIGTEEEIQNVLPVVEANEDEDTPAATEDIRLTSIRLGDTSTLAGKSVAKCGLREEYAAMLVALQRDNEYLQPNPSLMLEPGDVLWVVGDVKRLSALEA